MGQQQKIAHEKNCNVEKKYHLALQSYGAQKSLLKKFRQNGRPHKKKLTKWANEKKCPFC